MSEPFDGSDGELAALTAESRTPTPSPAARALMARYQHLDRRVWEENATPDEVTEHRRLFDAQRAWEAEHQPRFTGWEIERHPERFVGLTLTMAGKDAVRWEGVTVTAVARAHLLLTGGEEVTQIFTDSPVRRPIGTGTYPVACWDIARGFIHKEHVPGPRSG
ncbi:hypothetical protein [Nonomuraea sp. NPDC049695]|uniref:hypothetical protein n=1 Tax=Nonomuraea sp. NPDC049695 TaxID=3154734 RepID=UPI003442A57D